MKTLILIRHAKSSQGYAGLPDHSRPLNKRGFHDAMTMGKRVAQGRSVPQLLVSSSAVRVWSTAEIIATELDFPIEDIITEPSIYEAHVQDLLSVIRELNNRFICVALVGHNPGFTDVANLLANSDIDNVPTAGVVAIQFDVAEWRSVKFGMGTQIEFDYPKK